MDPDGPGHVELPRIILASTSPRRRELLERAGVAHEVMPASVDDGELWVGDGANPGAWVVALAHLKAESVVRDLADIGPGVVVLGADTVCVQDGAIIGQPEDEDHAREMIRAMRSGTHEVLTGVALIEPSSGERVLFVDRSVVVVGDVSDDQIEEYLTSGAWRGKAGAYNISERRDDGWDVESEGDERSIMGLPVDRVIGVISEKFGGVSGDALGV